MNEDEADELIRIIRALDKGDKWAVDKTQMKGWPTGSFKVEIW